MIVDTADTVNIVEMTMQMKCVSRKTVKMNGVKKDIQNPAGTSS